MRSAVIAFGFFLYALVLSAATPPSHASAGVRLGLLECYVEEGGAYVVGSNRAVSCTFFPTPGEPENYLGSLRRIGIDIGYTNEAKFNWAVFAVASDRYRRGALAGNYVGASANASFAIGLGANALVGGSRDNFALQPLSLQRQRGLNFAFGVARLQLQPVGR